jgi:hypothetical protein
MDTVLQMPVRNGLNYEKRLLLLLQSRTAGKLSSTAG